MVEVTGDTGAAAAAAAAAATAANAWLPSQAGQEGYDPELVGHAQNRGWDKLDPKKAALEAVKAHREASKMIGLPENRLLRLPADATDEAGWKGVWSKLGAGKEAKDYDLNEVKFTDGKALEAPFADAIKASAFKNNLPKAAAVEFAKDMVKLLEASTTAAAADNTIKLADEQRKLVSDWGPGNMETNTIIAKAAAAKLGPQFQAAVQALEGQVGYADVMKLMHKIGTSIGEDVFLKNLTPDKSGILTKEQAVEKRKELMADSAWSKRYLAGGDKSAEYREMQALIRIAQAE